MKNRILLTLIILGIFGISAFAQVQKAPAYPLIVHDPYFSIWSSGEKLTDEPTKHWTGKPHPLEGIITVDGVQYQFLGRPFAKQQTVLSTAAQTPYNCLYTFEKPENGWEKPDFKATNWANGTAPFGTKNQKVVATEWKVETEIWLRRAFDLPNALPEGNLLLDIRHDDGAEVYINGILAWSACADCNIPDYIQQPLSSEVKKSLKKGKNLIAIHCRNPRRNGFIDAGLSLELSNKDVQLAEQKSVEMTATRTIYTFNCGNVELQTEFLSPLLLTDIELLARPISYIRFTTKALDGKNHKTNITVTASPLMTVNEPTQETIGEILTASNTLQAARFGVKNPKILGKKGDNIRIDWGNAYLATPKSAGIPPLSIFEREGQKLYKTELGNKSIEDKEQSEFVMLGYDDDFSIQYFEENVRGWYHRDPNFSMINLLEKASAEYEIIRQKCLAFDTQLYDETLKSGGLEYAELCVLGYRQAIAAHKLVVNPDKNSAVPYLFFSKENFSNGSIGTVDVTYPSMPLFLRYNPEIAKALCEFIFFYSECGRWTKPFAAHDVGTYPQANGQTYKQDMPVEECGNMLIQTAAIVKAEGKIDYARQHWKTIKIWAEYLKEKGFDPENQLCTDDFAGHLARNANLSVKAIVALGGFATMAKQMGDDKLGEEYLKLAKEMATKWEEMTLVGDHSALTFDKDKDSWSQKYNLVWDKLLGLDLFPKTVYQREIAYYLTKQNKFGLPLDSRKTYTKADWIVWTATMADKKADFDALIKPLHQFAVETTPRVPLTDWYETTDGKKRGFQARSVVGGFYIKMLEDYWKKR